MSLFDLTDLTKDILIKKIRLHNAASETLFIMDKFRCYHRTILESKYHYDYVVRNLPNIDYNIQTVTYKLTKDFKLKYKDTLISTLTDTTTNFELLTSELINSDITDMLSEDYYEIVVYHIVDNICIFSYLNYKKNIHHYYYDLNNLGKLMNIDISGKILNRLDESAKALGVLIM